MSGLSPLRGKTAIAGAATAGIGEMPGWTPLELMAKAANLALADAGLTMDDVDGLCATTGYNYFSSMSAAEYLGVTPRYSNCDMNGGASFMAQLWAAAMAIDAGECEVALVCYGSNARTRGGDHAGLIETPEWEKQYRPIIPVSGYAMAAQRHMHEYGTTRENLADVVVAAREWGLKNPEAFVQKAISREEVLGARMLSDPLSVMDCCLVTDGAAAVILVSAERAKSMPNKPVYLLSSATSITHRQIDQMPNLCETGAKESSRRAYEMAGVQPSDIDVVQLYDAFSINVVLFLEDLGFCPKGEGGRFVADGNLAPGGGRPVNTNGGGISCVHPGMYGLFCLIEAVRQLRGEAGDRQLPRAELALAHGNGGTLSCQSTLLLGTDNVLS